MAISDPIADMLTRVRNALMAGHEQVQMPFSKQKKAVAEVLKAEGYISGFQFIEEGPQGVLSITLKYQGTTPVIEGIERVSKPSRRVYVKHDEIPKVLGGLGINVMSTPKGVVSDRTARKQRVGGEIICAVW